MTDSESARPMAGGQDLLTTMKERILVPKRVVNLKTIQGLDGIDGDGEKGLKIGALAKLHEIESHPEIIKSFPGLGAGRTFDRDRPVSQPGHDRRKSLPAAAMLVFPASAHRLPEKRRRYRATRKRARTNTTRSSAAGRRSSFIHPIWRPMLMALDATITINGPKGPRDVPIGKFFVLPSENASVENVLDRCRDRDADSDSRVRVCARDRHI